MNCMGYGKIFKLFLIVPVTLLCISIIAPLAVAQEDPDCTVPFTFEEAQGTVYGSLDTSAITVKTPLIRNGFEIDVDDTGEIATGPETTALHFHEVDSLTFSKVPVPPGNETSVLFRDSLAGEDPVFFIRESFPFVFELQSLIVGSSHADNSQTTGVGLSAYLEGNLVGTITLPTAANGYIAYSNNDLGELKGLFMDRLDVIGFSSNGLSYYMLDNVVFNTCRSPKVVQIDIQPGKGQSSINPKSRGVIPVAVLTTTTFDATTVDPVSVRFGSDEATESHKKGHIEDIDKDGDEDLVLHFRTQDTGIVCGDTEASLTGETFDGISITGTDAIRTVGCGGS